MIYFLGIWRALVVLDIDFNLWDKLKICPSTFVEIYIKMEPENCVEFMNKNVRIHDFIIFLVEGTDDPAGS